MMKTKLSSPLPFLILSFLFLVALPSCSDNSNKSLPAREYNGEWVEGDGDAREYDWYYGGAALIK